MEREREERRAFRVFDDVKVMPLNKAVNYADMILDYTKEESNERNNN